MRKICIIIILTLLSSNVSYSKDNPYKFLKKEILIGKAKKELVNDTRSISKKKALSIVQDENGKTLVFVSTSGSLPEGLMWQVELI